MRMSGHRTHAVFERYNAVDTQDLRAAVRALGSLENEGEEPKPHHLNTSVCVGGAAAYVASGEIDVPPSALVSYGDARRLLARSRLPPICGFTPSAPRYGLRGVGGLKQLPNAVFQ